MGKDGDGLQRTEDRSNTSKRELQQLRNEFMRESATQGVALEELARMFTLSESWVSTDILRGVPCRKREKGEKPLTDLEINDLKLNFVWLMGQQGYTIEQCNYMMSLTKEGDFDRQQRQAEVEKRYADLEAKHKRVVRNANKRVSGLEQQLENSADSYKEQAKQLKKQQLAMDALTGALKEAQAENERLKAEKAEPVVDTGEVESLKQQLEVLRKQLQEKDSEIAGLIQDKEQALEQAEVDKKQALKEADDFYKKTIAEYNSNLKKATRTARELKDKKIISLDAERKEAESRAQEAEGQVAEVKEQIESLEQAKDEAETALYVSQGQIFVLENELSKFQKKKALVGKGKKKLTGVQEEQVLDFYKRRKYVVTELSLRKLEKEYAIRLTKKAVYNLFDRFGVQKKK